MPRLQAAVRGLAGRGRAAELRRHKTQDEQALMASRIQASFRWAYPDPNPNPIPNPNPNPNPNLT